MRFTQACQALQAERWRYELELAPYDDPNSREKTLMNAVIRIERMNRYMDRDSNGIHRRQRSPSNGHGGRRHRGTTRSAASEHQRRGVDDLRDKRGEGALPTPDLYPAYRPARPPCAPPPASMNSAAESTRRNASLFLQVSHYFSTSDGPVTAQKIDLARWGRGASRRSGAVRPYVSSGAALDGTDACVVWLCTRADVW
jgi:hypothetical protein